MTLGCLKKNEDYEFIETSSEDSAERMVTRVKLHRPPPHHIQTIQVGMARSPLLMAATNLSLRYFAVHSPERGDEVGQLRVVGDR